MAYSLSVIQLVILVIEFYTFYTDTGKKPRYFPEKIYSHCFLFLFMDGDN